MSTINYLLSLIVDLCFPPLLITMKFHLQPKEISTVPTRTYGKGAFITMATKTLNNIQRQIKDPMINSFPQIDLMLSL